jgi:5S rRNA maturation endonuclease (ribonuclease M5)
MKRNYPLITIDRSKHKTYPFDFITCNDNTVGFIARVVPFFDDIPYNEFLNKSKEVNDSQYTSITHKLKKGGIILVVEDFLYDFEWTGEIKARIRTLLKKALKKFLHAEVDRSLDANLSIEDQIKQQELTIEQAKHQYDQLVKRSLGNKSIADYQIALAEATLDTLKSFRDNQKFINLN